MWASMKTRKSVLNQEFLPKGSAWLPWEEQPGWEMEKTNSFQVGQDLQSCIIWKVLGKQCWQMDLTDGGAGILPGLRPIKV